MNKILTIGLLALIWVSSASANNYENTLNEIGQAAATGGGALGIAWVHGIFWAKIAAFIVPVLLVIGFYMMKLEAKDQGLWKGIGMGFVGIVVGALFVMGLVAVESKTYAQPNCVGKVAIAYLSDSVLKGLGAVTGTEHQFGTRIRATNCF